MENGFAPTLLWAAVAGFVCAAMIPLEPDLLEEGMIVHFAERMVDGEHLYRDLVFFSGPFPFELLSLLFRIFGEEIAVARSVVVVASAVSTAATFDLARRSQCGWLAHVVAAASACAPILLFPLASIYYYSTLALSLSMLAACAAQRGLEDRRWAIAAGVLAALVAVTKQSVGIVMGPGLLLAVALNTRPELRRSRALDVAVGGLATTIVTLTYYGLRGDLGIFWHSMVVLPLSLGEGFGSPYMNMWPIGVAGPGIFFPFYAPQIANILNPQLVRDSAWLVVFTQTLYALPFLALLAVAMRRLLAGPLAAATWIVSVVLMAFLVQLFPRSDWGHLAYVLPPAFFVLVSAAGSFQGNVRSIPRFALSATLVVILVVGSGTIALSLHRTAVPSTLGPRVPQLALSAFYRRPDFGRVVDFLRARVEPGEAIFVARGEPLIYFATETRNPTPYAGIIPGLGEEQDRIVVEALEGVRFVAMSERDSDQYAYYRDELPTVQRYLERHFRVADPFVAQWGTLLVLERQEDRGATAVDLFDEAGLAKAWTRDRRGDEQAIDQPLPELVTRLNRRPLGVRLGPRGGGLDFEVEIPTGAVFEAGLGIRSLQAGSRLVQQPARSRFEVSIDRGSGFESYGFRHQFLNGRSASRWTPFRVDLSELGGHRVRLRLEVTPISGPWKAGMAWWGSPRLVSESSAGRGADGGEP